MNKTIYHSPLGPMTLLGDETSIYGLWFAEDKYIQNYDMSAVPEGMTPPMKEAVRWLDLYFSGKKPSFKLPLAPKGTAFQKKVWHVLETIPYGKSLTYKEVGNLVQGAGSKKNISRAVGSAVGRNPISILIPCHRVLGSGGSLTGYAGGLSRKKALLTLEGVSFKQ